MSSSAETTPETIKLPRLKTGDSGVGMSIDPLNERSDASEKDENSVDSSSKLSNNNDSEVDTEAPSHRSVVDDLMKKFNQTPPASRKESQESETDDVKTVKAEATEELLVEVNPQEFFQLSNNPNMLPTPKVDNQNNSSAFVNDEEEYNQIVAYHKTRSNSGGYVEYDKSQMSSDAHPPELASGSHHVNIQKPRTVAEKRRLVDTMDLDYLRKEQESKIFRQIQRHHDKLPINYAELDRIAYGSIPIKIGVWKVLTWLRTREGRYIQQYLEVGDGMLKLPGSRGNHARKFMPKHKFLLKQLKHEKFVTLDVRPNKCCPASRIDKRTLNNVMNSESIRKFILNNDFDAQRLSDCADEQFTKISPRPLSKKIEYINATRKDAGKVTDEDSCFLGDYIQYKMPEIKLQVVKSDQKPLPKTAKNYLGSILPHSSLSQEWCRFALSALKSSENDDDGDKKDEDEEIIEEKKRDSFEFKIPYKDDKDSIVARELVKKRDFDDFSRLTEENSKMVWTFDKDSDKDDVLEQEIVSVIKDLTKSVFINLNEDLFTKFDTVAPLQPSVESPEKSKAAIKELSTSFTNPKSKSNAVLRELKKLNANVYKSTMDIEDENALRVQATAHLGKEERGLRPTVILTENETVLLNGQERESRRQKRVPKRFSDYQNPDTIDEADMTGSKVGETSASTSKRQKLADENAQKPKTKLALSIQQMEEKKILKQKLDEFIHVSCVVRPLRCIDELEAWCMIHQLYKCWCQKPADENRPPQGRAFARVPHEQYMIINKDNPRELPTRQSESSSSDRNGSHSFHIVNLADLMDGKKGPIIINIFENNLTRSDPICNFILTNHNALIYFNAQAYYVDQKRVDTSRIDFSKISQEFEGPIFIIQSKQQIVPLQTTTFAEDFLKHMFTKPSDVHVEVKSQGELEQIIELVESILIHARQKVQQIVGVEPSEFLDEQLSILTRDRSRSQSVSSTTTSPLHFQGRQLTEAPAVKPNSALMCEFNAIFSRRMQTLTKIVQSNSLGLKPSNELLNKFYLYRWNFLLQSYEENLIHVWLVNIYSETGNEFQMLALTDKAEKPNVEHADKKYMKNIRELNLSDKMPELARLILLRIETDMTANLTILLYGCKGYLRICGMLNNKNNYEDKIAAKPCMKTHPHVAAKIRKVYNLWFETKQKKMRHRFQNMTEIEREDFKIAMTRTKDDEKSSEATSEELKPDEEPTNEAAAVPPPAPIRTYTTQSKINKPLPTSDEIRRAQVALFAPRGMTTTEPATRSITTSKNLSEFKWFLFNISDDFTYIFVKNWGRYLSKKVVLKAIHEAKQLKRAIAVEAVNRSWPKIYALPSAPLQFKEKASMTDNYLIFGPYLRHAESNLLLLRSEVKPKEPEEKNSRTRCLWIYANTLKIIQDCRPDSMLLAWGKDPTECREVTDMYIKNRLAQQKEHTSITLNQQAKIANESNDTNYD